VIRKIEENESNLEKNKFFPNLSFQNQKADYKLSKKKLYHHSSVTTTINYQVNFIHKEADDALDSVVNFYQFIIEIIPATHP
jgi:hypothetical protein